MDKHFVLVAKVHGRAVARTEQRGHVVPSFVTFYYTALNYVTLRYYLHLTLISLVLG